MGFSWMLPRRAVLGQTSQLCVQKRLDLPLGPAERHAEQLRVIGKEMQFGLPGFLARKAKTSSYRLRAVTPAHGEEPIGRCAVEEGLV